MQIFLGIPILAVFFLLHAALRRSPLSPVPFPFPSSVLRPPLSSSSSEADPRARGAHGRRLQLLEVQLAVASGVDLGPPRLGQLGGVVRGAAVLEPPRDEPVGRPRREQHDLLVPLLPPDLLEVVQ